jgi:preprotein translocase subunit SecD
MLSTPDGWSVTVRRRVAIAGTEFHRLRPGFMEDSTAIAIQLTPQGAKRLEDVTAAHKGETIALVLDNTVVSSAKITNVIRSDALLLATHMRTDDNVAMASRLLAAAPHCLPPP